MKSLHKSIIQWFANDNQYQAHKDLPNKVDWVRAIPFIAINLACLLGFWVGFSWVAFGTALVLYFVRVFSIGAFYHRFFSHRTYKTSRFCQAIFAVMGASAVQRGPLWWASHHRHHHAYSDQPEDAHSPIQHGFLWSHMGWFLSKKHYHYNEQRVVDLARFPELVFLDRFDGLVPMALIALLFIAGSIMSHVAPQLGTNGLQMVIWGFCISTIAVFHSTVTINSLSHQFGSRRFQTKDTSRNNFLLALITLGEGWHNNHHHYPATARQGFMWWEVDITYYVLKLMAKLGIIWDLRGVPEEVLSKKRVAPLIDDPESDYLPE